MIHKFSTYGRPHRLASRLVFYVSCSIASQSVQYITFECHGCRTSFNITFECHGIHIVQSSGLLQPHIIVWHTYLHRCSDTSDADASEMSWGEVWRKDREHRIQFVPFALYLTCLVGVWVGFWSVWMEIAQIDFRVSVWGVWDCRLARLLAGYPESMIHIRKSIDTWYR